MPLLLTNIKHLYQVREAGIACIKGNGYERNFLLLRDAYLVILTGE